jgi:PhnB protein
MKIVPYLNFNGQCKEAFEFYEQCLGGKIIGMTTNGNSPMADQMPAGSEDFVLHACLQVGDELLMASDSPEGQFQAPQGLWVSLHIDDVADAGRVFNTLAEGGSVQMPFEETFWAERFGMVTDRFGTPWMINCAGSKAQS